MAYCEYTHSDTVGWCSGGPNEPATNADGTRPTSIADCWANLVGTDFQTD